MNKFCFGGIYNWRLWDNELRFTVLNVDGFVFDVL